MRLPWGSKPKGLVERELCLVEERVGRWRHGVPGTGAWPFMRSSAEAVMVAAARAASEPVRPFHLAQLGQASIVVGEQPLTVEERWAFVLRPHVRDGEKVAALTIVVLRLIRIVLESK